MRDVVVDTSAFMKLLVYEQGSERMLTLKSEAPLLAPEYLLTETANVLWKKVRWSGLPIEDALAGLDVMERFDIQLVPTRDLLMQALALACELPHPLYDMLYLLVALRGGHPLATADAKRRADAEALGIKVEWVGAG